MWGNSNQREEPMTPRPPGGREGLVPAPPSEPRRRTLAPDIPRLRLVSGMADEEGGWQAGQAQTEREEGTKLPALTDRGEGSATERRGKKGKRVGRKAGGSKTARSGEDVAAQALAKYKYVRVPHWQRVSDETQKSEADITASMSMHDIVRSGLASAKFSEELLFMMRAQRQGFRLYELKLLKVNRIKCWARLQPFFFRVDAESQLLERFEVTSERAPEVKTGEWNLVGATLERVTLLRGVQIVGTGEGTAFVVTSIGAAGRTRRLCMCADTPQEADAFHKALTIGSDSLLFLHLKMGHDRGPSPEAPGGAGGGAAGRHKYKYQIGITDRKVMSTMVQDPMQMRTMVTAGLLQLKGEAGRTSVWYCGQGNVSDDLALAIARQWRSPEERRNVIEKVKLAGAMTAWDMVLLIEAPAPPGVTFLPKDTDFRGQPCLLNYRIDVNGGKLLRSHTLESLHRLCQLPLDVEVGYEEVEHDFKERETKDSKPLRDLITMLYAKNPGAREAVMRKLFHAGAKSLSELGRLIVSPAPPGHRFPPHALFRGRTCMLNYEIDRGGNKLLSAATLNKLYEGFRFYESQQKAGANMLYKKMMQKQEPKVVLAPSSNQMKKGHAPLLRVNPEAEKTAVPGQAAPPTKQDKFVFEDPLVRVPIRGKVSCIAFSACGKMMAVGTREGSVFLMSCGGGVAGGGSPLGSVLPKQPASTGSGAGESSEPASPRMKMDLGGGAAGGVGGEWKVVGELKRHQGCVNVVSFRRDMGEPFFPRIMLTSGADDGSVCVWDCDGMLRQPKKDGEAKKEVGKKAAKATGQRCFKILGHQGRRVLCCKFSPDGKTLVTATDDGEVRLFDVMCWNTLPGHTKSVRCMTPVKDNSWSMTHLLQGHSRAVNAVDFAHSSPMLGTGSDDKTLRLWSLEAEKNEWVCNFIVSLPFPISSFQFDTKGPTVVVSCSGDDRAYVWDVGRMQDFIAPWDYQVLDCGDDRDELMCSTSSMNGRASFVGIGLDDGSVRIFAPKSSKRMKGALGKYRQVGRLRAENNATCMGASRDAQYLAMAGESYDAFFTGDGKLGGTGMLSGTVKGLGGTRTQSLTGMLSGTVKGLGGTRTQSLNSAKGIGRHFGGTGPIPKPADMDVVTVWEVGTALAFVRDPFGEEEEEPELFAAFASMAQMDDDLKSSPIKTFQPESGVSSVLPAPRRGLGVTGRFLGEEDVVVDDTGMDTPPWEKIAATDINLYRDELPPAQMVPPERLQSFFRNNPNGTLPKGFVRSDSGSTLLSSKRHDAHSPANRRMTITETGVSGMAGNAFDFFKHKMPNNRGAGDSFDRIASLASAGSRVTEQEDEEEPEEDSPGRGVASGWLGGVGIEAGSSSSEDEEGDETEKEAADAREVILRVQKIVEHNAVWVDHLCKAMRSWMGNDSFFQLFEPGSSGRTVPEIAALLAADSLLRLSKSHADTNNDEFGNATSKNISEVMGEREDCAKAERLTNRILARDAKTPGTGSLPGKKSSKTRSKLAADAVLALRQGAVTEGEAAGMMRRQMDKRDTLHPDRAKQMFPMLLDWLLQWPKLFEVVWSAYCFNKMKKNKCHESIQILELGRVIEKVEESEFQLPTSAILTPAALRTNPVTEIEFQIEHINKWGGGEESLRVGICTGMHDVMRGEDAGSHSGGWMFGCGTGMKFHNGQVSVYGNKTAAISDKVAVVLDWGKASVSITINGAHQGIMYAGLPVHQPLYFVADLTTRGERLRIPDVLVRNGWNHEPKRLIVDPLEFIHT